MYIQVKMEDKSVLYGKSKTTPTIKNNIVHPLEGDFEIYTGARYIPVPKQPVNLPYGILGLCTKGHITLNVYLHELHLTAGQLLVLLPGELVSIKEKSEDFEMDYFLVSQTMINDTLDGIPHISPFFFMHMRRKYYYVLSDCERRRYSDYFRLVYDREEPIDNLYMREYLINILRLFYLDLYNNYNTNILSVISSSAARKEKLTYDFFLLLMEHCRENREIAFYANKLFITPKYLTLIIKEISGRSAKDWIVDYIVLEIKALLKNSLFNIQEITVKTNFSNQASLGRFFRKHTGMSPSEYRISSKNKKMVKSLS